MTKDEAISINVRLMTAIHALNEASSLIQPFDEGSVDEVIAESLQEAAQAASTALSQLKNIIGF